MEQRISLVTLGVHDLQRARSFYERLGWRGQQVQETVFFQAGGLAFVLWDRTKLAADCGLEDRGADGSTAAFSGIALAHNVRRREEVGDVLTAARAAGAAITRPATTTFYGGCAGVFTDPDGHAVIFNGRWRGSDGVAWRCGHEFTRPFDPDRRQAARRRVATSGTEAVGTGRHQPGRE